MSTADDLYRLLPAIFHLRDAEVAAETAARFGLRRAGDDTPEGPLHSLLAVLALQFDLLDAEIAALGDAPFIETCPEWAVPYIGELIGARIVETGETGSARRQVADTIGNRRSKGTARALARRAGAVAGAPAEAIEYFEHLVTALHLDYPGDGRPMSVAVNGRPGRSLALPTRIGQHCAEVRDISAGGRFAATDIGIRVWPLRALAHNEVVPTPVAGGAPGRYMLSPLGADLALWRRPQRDRGEVTRLSLDEIPGPIPLSDAHDRPEAYWGAEHSVAVWIDGVPLALDEICFCDLADQAADGSTWNARGTDAQRARVRVDPHRGRIALPTAMLGLATDRMRARYHYGDAALVGGGVRPSAAGADDLPAGSPTVPQDATRAEAETALSDALADLDAAATVRIAYGGTLSPPAVLDLPAGVDARLIAGDGIWPLLDSTGNWRVQGGAQATLTLEGVRLAGGALEIATAGLDGLVLRDCTLVPGLSLTRDGRAAQPDQPSLVIRQPGLHVQIERSIVGAIRCDEGVRLTVIDSIVDAPDPDAPAIAGNAGPAAILGSRRSTFLGDVRLAAVDEISDCLFASRPGRSLADPAVSAARLQQGCVRHSALPPEVSVPRRYRCYPPEGAIGSPAPVFASLVYGTPTYAMLLTASPSGIRRGGERGREMGAMNRQSWAMRSAALMRDLPDWTPFAMTAGIEILVE